MSSFLQNMGYRRRQNLAFPLGGAVPTPLAQLSPSANWTGTAGSGFASVPADPVRSTAKPAVRLLTPPRQHFTTALDVGVIAAANDGGSLASTLGIEKVIFHYEGGTAEITEPKWHAVSTPRGIRRYYGWWVNLRKVIGTVGAGNLYVEAVPRDATMQRRVIGPYLYSPVDTLHDQTLEVAPSQPEIAGQRYQSIKNAADYARLQSADNPLITITEAGQYQIEDIAIISYDTMTGYANITASVPGVSIGYPSFSTVAAAAMPYLRMPLRLFGTNLTLDYEHMWNIASAFQVGIQHWLDGINVTSSAPAGKDTPVNGNPPMDNSGSGGRVNGAPYWTECEVQKVHNPFNGSSLVRGCHAFDIGYDIVSEALCVVGSLFERHEDNFWNTERNAFTVSYSGAESTATIQRTGNVRGFNGGEYVVTLGATEYRFDVGGGLNEDYISGASGDGYFFADVVEWLNTLPGMSAALDPAFVTQDFAANSGALPGDKGLGNDGVGSRSAPADLTGGTVQFVSFFDVHGDFYQHINLVKENVIVAFNNVVDAQVQSIFLSPVYSGATAPGENDILFFGNAFYISPIVTQYYDPDAMSSQFGRTDLTASHVVIAHNTFANQRWFIRSTQSGFTADGYTLFSNNIASDFLLEGGNNVQGFTIDGLHLHQGATLPSSGINFSIGGDESNLFVDAAAGDFTPAGALLTAGVVPTLTVDRTRAAYPALACMGAVAAEASEEITDAAGSSGSLDPQGDLIASMNTAGGQSSFHNYAQASAGPPLTSQDLTANDNDHLANSGGKIPSVVAGGALFDTNDQIEQTISGGTFTIALSYTPGTLGTSGTLLSDQGSAVNLNYQNGAGGNTVLPYASSVFEGDTETVVTTRQQLYDALASAVGEVAILVTGINHSGDTRLRIGRGSGTAPGTYRKAAVIDEVTHADTLALDRTLAREAVLT